MEKNIEGKTLADLAAEKLMDLIREREYLPGDKLPTEAELSEWLKVGRNTVREAVRILVSRNIVTVRQGSGTFISEKQGVIDDPFGFSFMGDRGKLTRDLIQVRIMLEPPIAALAAQNSQKDIQFHEQIANCTHNSVMSNLIPVIGKGVAVFASEVQQQEYEQTLISHRIIFQAIKEGRGVEAQQAMHFHLLYNENRYLEEQEGAVLQETEKSP